jgi:endonuclease YncB( thermonuclease family)
MAAYSADLLHVHDGDTMRFRITLGFGIEVEHNIRLLGVNAPELSTPAGKTSAAWATAWFAAHPGPYKLDSNPARAEDKYGRYLTSVVAADGTDLATELLAAGQAVPYP